MEFSREKQAGRLQNDSGQPLTRQPRFQIADNRPEAAWQAKMVGMIEEGNSNLSQMTSGSTAGRTPLQRKPWPKAFLPAVAQEPMYLSTKVSAYKAKVYKYDSFDDEILGHRSEAVVDIAKKVASTEAIPPPNKFLSTKVIEKIYGKDKEKYVSGTEPVEAKNKIIYNQQIDPFYYRLIRKYGDNKKLDVYYQFAKSSYGYIVKIKDDVGPLYNMDTNRGAANLHAEQQNAPIGKDNEVFRQYPSSHDFENATKIKELADKDLTDQGVGFINEEAQGDVKAKRQDALDKRSLYLDAITKLGGEGARFQCVRNHMTHLTNDSIFYHVEDEKIKGVTFKKLWGMWKSKFNYAFNIDNKTVINNATMDEYKQEDLVIGRDFDLDNDKAKQ